MKEDGSEPDGAALIAATIDVGVRLRHALVEALAPLGITPEQHEVLAAVAEGRSSPGEIARVTGRDKTTLSRIVARARRSGLLVMEVSEDDRRRQVLRLTDEGRLKVDLGRSALDRTVANLLSPLKRRQVRRLSKLLRKLGARR